MKLVTYALIGAAICSFHGLMALVGALVQGDKEALAGALQTIALLAPPGAAAGIVHALMSTFRRASSVRYYVGWIVTTCTCVLGALLWLATLRRARGYAPNLDVSAFTDPWSIGFWIVSASLVGIFLGRWMRREQLRDGDEESRRP